MNYKYDGLGRRIEKEIIEVTTTVKRYIYDNEDILLELDGSNNITTRYTHGPGIDEPLVMEKGGASFFCHADGLGSITEITDSVGVVKQRYTYSSFGKIESQLDPSFVQPYTFTGREFDQETGLYFYRARTYDSRTGRFIQEDPVLHAGSPDLVFALPLLLGNPSMLHTFTYVLNNPTRLRDPQGLFTYYGNWCGPNWTGGKKEVYHPEHDSSYKSPIDKLDMACKTHDICYYQCRKNYACAQEARGQCMITCDRALANNAQINGPRSIGLYAWMRLNKRPDTGTNESCGCTQNDKIY